MSAKQNQHEGFRSSQRLFLLGVTTFGAMLVFVSSSTVVRASETDETVSTSTKNTDMVTKDSTDPGIKETNEPVTDDTSDASKVSAQYLVQASSDTSASDKTPTDSIETKSTKAVTTTIGNSVEDTQTYQAIQKTTDTMNTSQVNIDQAYFGLAGDKVVDKQLANMDATTAAKLNDDGYLIKSGIVNNKKTLVVQGKDTTGLFYGINHLNNLIAEKSDLSKANISESPQMSIRGVIEGFYGEPWSQQARKDLFKFMGDHKMNVYIYSPKDDDYLRKNWKELYPQEKLDQIKDLIVSAKKNHVQFVYTLSPGNDITYSSKEDFDKTVAKLNQLKSIGVTQFYIALDDIPLGMTDADAAIFKNHPTTNYPNNPWSGLADVQAFYVNKVQQDYIKKNNLPDLWLVPTNYNGSKQDPFKEAQGEALDKDIHLQWTGEGVFSGDITNESVEQAKKTYHTDHIFIWDNFPVNDSDQERLYLNPIRSRSKKLYQIMDGFTSNPMVQPYASWIGLSSYGDYMWNADKYNPDANLQATIRELAGDEPEVIVAMQQFVDLNQYWNYAIEEDQTHAPILSSFINKFEQAEYGTPAYQEAKNGLLDRLNIISNLPTTLQKLKTSGFYNDSLPWINAAGHWGKAMIAGVEIMDAIKSNQTDNLNANFSTLNEQVELANEKSLPDNRTGKPELVLTPTVGDGLFERFIAKANQAVDGYLGTKALIAGTTQVASEATTNIPQNGDYAPSNMNDNDLNTKFWSNRSVKTGDTIAVDLKETQEIQRINIHQGVSDDATSGDIFKTATIYAGNSADGSDKVAIGEVMPTGNYQLDLNQPIKARYIFITATSNSDNWLQIRNISVFGKTGLSINNIQATDNSSSKAMFDGTVKTAFTGTLTNDQTTGTIEQTFEATDAKSVYLAGKVSGTIYVHQNNKWQELGRAESNQSLNNLKVESSSIDGIKLVIDSNTSDFVINEFGLSNK
ncbi:beta-N-acetylglucosaminidase domain-containing protein [Companilactobacillus huachuanensis]|uniref:Beta-N-acetylglucosaminidase domain-containing protein n=1 Tax=Companilactobacillus huachuanensis TaxID=2559914 RepID=A0ABW1RJQ9_9LACO|nr:beta-N-acetylglucosaminidase domain-containing protein [Companilactobacillus huachuanensis]